jgi:hypothetical protein
MTPEQITSHCVESVSDRWSDSAGARMFKAAGVLLLIVALLAYLVVPFNTFTRTYIRGQGPTRARPIPVSPPQHEGVRLSV